MTLHDEPPIVDIDELLREQEEHEGRATRIQWALVVIGGVVGITGSLAALVIAAPAILDLVSWIHSIQVAVNR